MWNGVSLGLYCSATAFLFEEAFFQWAEGIWKQLYQLSQLYENNKYLVKTATVNQVCDPSQNKAGSNVMTSE